MILRASLAQRSLGVPGRGAAGRPCTVMDLQTRHMAVLCPRTLGDPMVGKLLPETRGVGARVIGPAQERRNWGRL